MAKLVKRIKRLFTSKANKLINKVEDSLEVIEYEIEQSEKVQSKLEDSIANIKGTKRFEEEKIKKSRKMIKDYQFLIDDEVKRDRENGVTENKEAEKLWDAMTIEKERLEAMQQNVSSYDKILNRLETELDTLKEKIQEKKRSLGQLRVKKETAENLSRVNRELQKYSSSEYNFSDMKKAEEDIQKELYKQVEKNKMIVSSEETAETILKKRRRNGYYDYVNAQGTEEAKEEKVEVQ